jgi:hypothetical protein
MRSSPRGPKPAHSASFALVQFQYVFRQAERMQAESGVRYARQAKGGSAAMTRILFTNIGVFDADNAPTSMRAKRSNPWALLDCFVAAFLAMTRSLAPLRAAAGMTIGFGAAPYLRAAQARWMRRPASSSASVAVA